MEERNCDERLVAVEQRAVSNTRRIDKLEQSNEAMLELVSSVKVLATKMDYVCKSQDELNGRLTIVEDKPAAEWSRSYLRSLWLWWAFALAIYLEVVSEHED